MSEYISIAASSGGGDVGGRLRVLCRAALSAGLSGAFKNVRIPATVEEEVRVSPRSPALSRGYAAAARMRARNGLRE